MVFKKRKQGLRGACWLNACAGPHAMPVEGGFMNIFTEKFLPTFEEAKVYFESVYHDELSSLNHARSSFKSLTKGLFQDFGLSFVESRVKKPEESIKKYEGKYLKDDEDSQKGYSITSKITDVLGVRIVCYYEDQINEIVDVLKNEFTVIGITDKTSELKKSDNEFGYRSFHIDVKLNEKRKELDEYRILNNVQVEIQVRTIAQHTWCVIDHKIKYKKSAPHAIKRRIASLAALFEIIDREFVEIKKGTTSFEETGYPKIDVVDSIENENKDKESSFFGFLKFLKNTFPTYSFTPSSVDSFYNNLSEILLGSKYENSDFLIKSISKHLHEAQRFSHSLKENFNQNLNPYTEIRHALYLADKDVFKNILFEYQKKSLEIWQGNK